MSSSSQIGLFTFAAPAVKPNFGASISSNQVIVPNLGANTPHSGLAADTPVSLDQRQSGSTNYGALIGGSSATAASSNQTMATPSVEEPP
ncbi:unnamed protein product [Protopolystoma xenopodis]|uniref:Uncharacterized protein n=1 Tax=Protopolystoma xenopodis TaxID=117903 RepID=A0A448X0X8_9PLAT|nr:unnamed protein product [Protopolystoma xenopodis]